MNKVWRLLPDAPQSFYEEHPELPPLVARLLYQRGITTQGAIDEFLNPDYSVHVHDPFLFRDMTKAVDRIFLAQEKGKITIHGDLTPMACRRLSFYQHFRTLGIEHDVFLPHRETDGYGLNAKTVDLLKSQGTECDYHL